MVPCNCVFVEFSIGSLEAMRLHLGTYLFFSFRTRATSPSHHLSADGSADGSVVCQDWSVRLFAFVQYYVFFIRSFPQVAFDCRSFGSNRKAAAEDSWE